MASTIAFSLVLTREGAVLKGLGYHLRCKHLNATLLFPHELFFIQSEYSIFY